MAEVIARTSIKRDNNLMYYVKSDGNVWATPRKRPGVAKGKARKIASTELTLDYSRFIYFIDKSGNVARAKRKNR